MYFVVWRADGTILKSFGQYADISSPPEPSPINRPRLQQRGKFRRSA